MKRYPTMPDYSDVVRMVMQSHNNVGNNELGNPIYIHTTPYPVLNFRSTVKIDGENCAIIKYKDGSYEFQGRLKQLSLENDNFDFMNQMQSKNYQSLFNNIEFNDYCAIYGEWCGKDIMGKYGIAISQLSDRKFIITTLRIDDVFYSISNYPHIQINAEEIYNIMQFPSTEISIDFNEPALMEIEIKKEVQTILDECPVAKYFGVTGKGEGLVYEHINGDLRYVFKAKNVQKLH